MPFDDPRDFLEYLEERKELLRITAEVDPKFDIGAYIRKTSDQQGPALLFDNVKGSDMVVAGGIFATRARVLLALETDKETVYERFYDGVTNPIPPRLIETGQGGDGVDSQRRDRATRNFRTFAHARRLARSPYRAADPRSSGLRAVGGRSGRCGLSAVIVFAAHFFL